MISAIWSISACRRCAGHDSLFARDPEIKREAVFVGPVMRTGSTLVRRTRDYAEVSRGNRARLRRDDEIAAAYRSVLAEYAHPGAHPELAAVRDRLRELAFLRRLPGGRRRTVAPAPASAPAHRCSPTTALIWRPRCRRSSRPAFDDLAACRRRRVRRCDRLGGGARRSVRSPAAAARHAAAAARRRAIRRHTAIPAVGRRTAEPPAAFSDGAQRAGDLTAPGPGAAVGGTDPRGGRVRRRSSSSRTPRAMLELLDTVPSPTPRTA